MSIERMVAMSIDTAYHAAPGVEEAPQTEEAQQAAEAQEVKTLPHQIKPIHGFDTYVPEDKTLHESIGIYRVTGQGGTPKIEFDHTKPAEEETSDVTTTNTDKVDEEIEQLKEKQEELSRQIEQTDDPEKKAELEKQLAQVEQELLQKDNDTYRRQQAEIS